MKAFYFFIIFLYSNLVIAGSEDVVLKDVETDHVQMIRYHLDRIENNHLKIEEQIEALRNKPRTAFFGRNGKNIRKHVEYKIHKFESEILESVEEIRKHKKYIREAIRER